MRVRAVKTIVEEWHHPATSGGSHVVIKGTPGLAIGLVRPKRIVVVWEEAFAFSEAEDTAYVAREYEWEGSPDLIEWAEER